MFVNDLRIAFVTIVFLFIQSIQPIAAFKAHREDVYSVIFSPDGKLLVSGSQDGTVKLWDTETQECLATLEGKKFTPIFRIALSPDGKLIAAAEGKEVVLWHIESRQRTPLSGELSKPVRSVAFSPDGKVVVAGSDDGAIRVWSVTGRNHIATLMGHRYIVKSVTFSPDGKLIASAAGGSWIEGEQLKTLGEIKLWDTETWKCLATLKEGVEDIFKEDVWSIAFSPDGKLLASAHAGGLSDIRFSSFPPIKIKLWDVGSKECITTLSSRHTRGTAYIAFSPDGQFIVSGDSDGKLSLWNVENKEIIWTFKAHDRIIKSVAFSPDGELIASGDMDGIIQLFGMKWILANHRPTLSFSPPPPYVVQVGSGLNITVVINDEDGDRWKIFTTGAVGSPRPVAFLVNEANFTWDKTGTNGKLTLPQVKEQHIGEHRFILTVDDQRGGITEETIIVTVVPKKPEDNQLPVVSFSFSPEKPSEKVEVVFDASRSQDPDGQIVSYQWDFGDRSTGEGKIVKHSYSSKGQYTVTLKVTDNGGATATASAKIIVIPDDRPTINDIKPPSGAPGIEVIITGRNFDKIVGIQQVTFGGKSATIKEWSESKLTKLTVVTVEVPYGKGTVDVSVGGPTARSNSVPFTYKTPTIQSLQPSSGKPGTAVTIKGSDFGEKGFSPSFYVKFGKSLAPKMIKPWTNTEIVTKAPSDCGTGENDKKMLVLLLKLAVLQWQGLTKEAIEVVLDEVEKLAIKKAIEYLESQGVRISGVEKRIEVDVKVVTPAGESAPKVFTYEVAETMIGKLFSPGELRIYDSQGRVTGLVNGEVKEEIPDSLYDPENETFIVFNASDVYRYEVIGKEKGDYGLKLTYVGKEKVTFFQATDIPTSAKTVHQYNIDWSALGAGQKAVTLQMDLNGDGVFDQTVTSDNELTPDECLPPTGLNPDGKLPITWGWVKQTKLFQNYPNPFNPETWIPYQLSEGSRVVIRIYDATGNLVRRIELGEKPAGLYLNQEKAANWDGRNDRGELVASGVYFYHFQAGLFRGSRKMVILR